MCESDNPDLEPEHIFSQSEKALRSGHVKCNTRVEQLDRVKSG